MEPQGDVRSPKEPQGALKTKIRIHSNSILSEYQKFLDVNFLSILVAFKLLFGLLSLLRIENKSHNLVFSVHLTVATGHFLDVVIWKTII